MPKTSCSWGIAAILRIAAFGLSKSGCGCVGWTDNGCVPMTMTEPAELERQTLRVTPILSRPILERTCGTLVAMVERLRATAGERDAYEIQLELLQAQQAVETQYGALRRRIRNRRL